MCDEFLTTKFLKFDSYWKYTLTFVGIYANKEYNVDIYVYNNEIDELPLNKNVSINDLCECAFIKIKSGKIIDISCLTQGYNSIFVENNLELKEGVFVPTLFNKGFIIFNSIKEEISKYLEYRADLSPRYYSRDEVNNFYYIDQIGT